MNSLLLLPLQHAQSELGRLVSLRTPVQRIRNSETYVRKVYVHIVQSIPYTYMYTRGKRYTVCNMKYLHAVYKWMEAMMDGTSRIHHVQRAFRTNVANIAI